METAVDNQLQVKFSEEMIPFNVNRKLQSLLWFIGLLNFVGFYFFSAFLNKITIIFDSASDSILCIM
jgi:hypothetical protein